jgi:hypothetical protein
MLCCSTRELPSTQARTVHLHRILRQERHPSGRVREEAYQRVRVATAVQDRAKFDPAQFNHTVGTAMSDDERHAEPEPVRDFTAEDKAVLAKVSTRPDSVEATAPCRTMASVVSYPELNPGEPQWLLSLTPTSRL